MATSELSWPDDWHAMSELNHKDAEMALTTITNRLFLGGGFDDNTHRMLATGCGMAVDHTVRTYGHARNALDAWIERDEHPGAVLVSPIFRTSAYLEDCLKALNRAVNFAEKLAEEGAGVVEKPILDTEDRTQLREMRNAPEHMEDDIAAGRVGSDYPLVVIPGPKNFQIAGYTTSYALLRHWIEELATIARELAEYGRGEGENG